MKTVSDASPTRAEGPRRLAAFAPGWAAPMPPGITSTAAPRRHDAVSGSSPSLRRKLVSEPEAIAQAIGAHGFCRATKFVAAVAWHATSGVGSSIAPRFEPIASLARFDASVHELVTTGNLHNDTRMWFASNWNFTLLLPWQLGAAFHAIPDG